MQQFRIIAHHKKSQKQMTFICSSYEQLLAQIQKDFKLPKIKIIQPLIKNNQTLAKQCFKIPEDKFLKISFIQVRELTQEEQEKLREQAKVLINRYERESQEKYQENIIAHFALLLRKIPNILNCCVEKDKVNSLTNMVKKDYVKAMIALNDSINIIKYQQDQLYEKKLLDLVASLMISCEFQSFELTDTETTRFFRKILQIFSKEIGKDENLWELMYCTDMAKPQKIKCNLLEFKLHGWKCDDFGQSLFQQILRRNQEATSLQIIEFPQFLFIKMCKFIDKGSSSQLPIQEHYLKNYNTIEKKRKNRQISELFQSPQWSDKRYSFPFEIVLNKKYQIEEISEMDKSENCTQYKLIGSLCVPKYKENPDAICNKIDKFLVIEREQGKWLAFQNNKIRKENDYKWVKSQKWRDFVGLYQRR